MLFPEGGTASAHTSASLVSSSFDPNTYYATKYTYDPAGNVTRIEYPQCDYPNQLIITNYLPHDYFALTSISNGTEDNPAEITIQPGQDITFKAQESITLLPGFTVKEGAIFKAEIGIVSTRPIEYVTYSYDNDKRVKTIGTVTNPNRYAEYTYGDNDELIQERINNRNNTYFDINYSYNSPLWPLSIASNLYLEELNYTGNYNGNVSSIFHTVFDYPQNSYLYNFQWDDVGRLICANNPADLTGTNYNYTAIEYDANGNILTSERSSQSQYRSFTYNYQSGTNKVNQVSYVYGSNRESANQITTHSNYVYDANGSVLSSSKLNKSLLMDYDIRSNLVSSIAVNNQYIIDYDYDASGERVYSGMGNSSKIYINSITSNPLTIIDSNDNATHYIYGPKGIVAKRNESLTYFMLKDHLGSTRVVMNENNQAISSYDYDAWGNPMNSTVSEMSAYRYTGREYDEETGLHNFRARLYDSTLMRFYQVDPAEQFASPYVYCGNNPITLIDPSGRNAEYFPVGDDISEEDVSNSVNAIVDAYADTFLPITASNGQFSLANPELTNANLDKLSPDQKLFYQVITDPKFTMRVGITNGLYVTCAFRDERFATTIVKADQYVNNTYNKKTNEQIATGYVHMESMQAASRLSGQPLDQIFNHFVNESYLYSVSNPNRRWSRSEYLKAHEAALGLQTNTRAHSLQAKEITRYYNGAYQPVVRYRWLDPESGMFSVPIEAKLK